MRAWRAATLHAVRALRFTSLSRPAGCLRAADGRVIAAHAVVADGLVSRMVGMLGTPDPGPDEALVLWPCNWVHGVGLRAVIGAAFIDGTGRVLRVVDPLPRRGARCPGAVAVIEAATGVLGLGPGDHVRVDGVAVFPHGGPFA